MPHDAKCSSVPAVAIGSRQPLVTEHHSGQVESRLRGVDQPRDTGEGQVTGQNAMGTTPSQRREESSCAGHGSNRSVLCRNRGTGTLPYPVRPMCGIVGYVGQRPACDVVVDALRRMEYRGYDSAGVALLDGTGRNDGAPPGRAGWPTSKRR